eukprot:651812_1
MDQHFALAGTNSNHLPTGTNTHHLPPGTNTHHFSSGTNTHHFSTGTNTHHLPTGTNPYRSPSVRSAPALSPQLERRVSNAAGAYSKYLRNLRRNILSPKRPLARAFLPGTPTHAPQATRAQAWPDRRSTTQNQTQFNNVESQTQNLIPFNNVESTTQNRIPFSNTRSTTHNRIQFNNVEPTTQNRIPFNNVESTTQNHIPLDDGKSPTQNMIPLENNTPAIDSLSSLCINNSNVDGQHVKIYGNSESFALNQRCSSNTPQYVASNVHNSYQTMSANVNNNIPHISQSQNARSTPQVPVQSGSSRTKVNELTPVHRKYIPHGVQYPRHPISCSKILPSDSNISNAVRNPLKEIQMPVIDNHKRSFLPHQSNLPCTPPPTPAIPPKPILGGRLENYQKIKIQSSPTKSDQENIPPEPRPIVIRHAR